MPRRSILTARQRAALFDLPTDEASLLRHYTMADDHIEHVRERWRPENQLGFALQLCALRHPGRLLGSGEVIPEEALNFIGAQAGHLGRRLDQPILPARRLTPKLCGCPGRVRSAGSRLRIGNALMTGCRAASTAC